MNPLHSRDEALWHPVENGATLSQQGSEHGIIVRDEEHRDGARITLEREVRTIPFAITCGIYGWLVHTAFAANEAEAHGKYAAMKERLHKALGADERDLPAQLDAFVRAF